MSDFGGESLTRLALGRKAASGEAVGEIWLRSRRLVQRLFHRAMARARERAGGVEMVHGSAAQRLRESGGGLGALLRYRLAAPRRRPANSSTFRVALGG